MFKKIFFTFSLLCMSMLMMAQSGAIYDVAEQMPAYRGGDKAIYDYLQANLVYPEDAKAQGAQGRVMVTFVVETDGSISHIQLARKAELRSMDNEAIRLIVDMPEGSWTPAQMQGKPVRCRCTVSITFRL